jgi:hypothetical protein
MFTSIKNIFQLLHLNLAKQFLCMDLDAETLVKCLKIKKNSFIILPSISGRV